ncbi:lysine transporter LysE [Arenibaculum pallidiluteum]|uniref:lysine transporter LysE n=1 Tax=Arenibaculum pallidiluteum TaxID=2812559 RepID=UPI001A956672|nr:lysine transporter LysE [Arenibaculum pallidiluteum]
MTEPALLIPVAAILATPGPTNTLLAASAARRGIVPSLSLVPAELTGYLVAIAAWGLVLGPAMAVLPQLGPALRLACAAYLARAAVRLWRAGAPGGEVAAIGPCGVLVATLLNPKALLFAVGVFPEAAFHSIAGFLEAAGGFSAVLVPVALGWIALGAGLAGGGRGRRSDLAQRGAAMVLLAFSASLGASALA